MEALAVFNVVLYFVAIFLLFAPLSDWTATYILFRASKKVEHESIALMERAKIATILAIVTTLNSILAMNRLFNWHLPEVVVLSILSTALVLVSVPNLYWLSLYLRNRFRKK